MCKHFDACLWCKYSCVIVRVAHTYYVRFTSPHLTTWCGKVLVSCENVRIRLNRVIKAEIMGLVFILRKWCDSKIYCRWTNSCWTGHPSNEITLHFHLIAWFHQIISDFGVPYTYRCKNNLAHFLIEELIVVVPGRSSVAANFGSGWAVH